MMCGYTEAEVLELLTTARREGWEEGYGQAQGDGNELLQSTQGIMYDAGKQEGRMEGYERGVKNGEECGRTAKQNSWETRHGPDRCEE
jgi:flagellar biosynthesis/type III secretory pathway protein FliH